MKLKALVFVALTATAIMAFAAPSASATTLEWVGVPQNGPVGTSANATAFSVLSRTDGTLLNTCAASSFSGTTSVYTGTKVTGALSSWPFSSCNFTVTTQKAGQLYFEHESGTTNGNVFSENTKIETGTSLGFHVTCETSAGVNIGTLTGATTGSNPSTEAVMHVNAVLNCGWLVPSASWKGTYKFFGNELSVSA